ncbi:MAG TPA: hypothetical protein VIF62_33160 [Labilithrix sp.]|jgi:hypothetical protein
MKKPSFLPDDLLWAEGGHASDVVLTALADGQIEIVPPNARTHVEGCATCTRYLGNAALLSLHTHAQIAVMQENALVAARRPLPKLAIALGLLVAAAGMIPSFGSDADEARTFASHVPLFFRSAETLGRKLFEPGSETALVVTYATAAVLVVMAVALVRLLPKKETSR